MPSNRATVLCRYHYDALNRLAASTPSAQSSAQRHLKDRPSTEIQGAVQRSIAQHEDHRWRNENTKPPPCTPTSWPRTNNARC